MKSVTDELKIEDITINCDKEREKERHFKTVNKNTNK